VEKDDNLTAIIVDSDKIVEGLYLEQQKKMNWNRGMK
jgi:hypothetical protein